MNLRTLTVNEAAKETGMPPAAIRRLLESGQVAGNRNGRSWRVSASSLEAWVNRTPSHPSIETRAFPEVEDRFA